ncbi:uncharacterized protein LOC132933839 [Metopolophium dirhodum]|uniref:uncharacterized protein LOC132933839 n=1 Tax=Metopolophium dirhodum TaxID=44670 RepID=UPI0029905ACB|nr:uncharacterized protein LOC132933839 [Metopolophium dirhodum]
MTKMFCKTVRTTVVYVFTVVQLLPLLSTVVGGGTSQTTAPSGAEFLHSVIGNMQRPTRKVFNERIDVEEYIPDDVPYTPPANEINMLSKQPFHFNNQANRVQADVTKNHIGSLLSQIAPQFLKNEFAESQNRIVTQVAPQQFNPGPTSPQQFNQGPNGPQLFNPAPNGPQQFNPAPNSPQNIIDAITSDTAQRPPDGMISGYNYFFYPLDNNALQQVQNGNGNQMAQTTAMSEPEKPDNQAVAKPRVQPLFVAMAGFVGVAVVFLSALMFVPILPIHALTSKAALKRAPEELASLTKLVAESIDGKDCSERIACEVGRAMRSMRVGNKPIRMMEIILPPAVAKQLAQIRRSATKKEQCHFIMCKKTEGTLHLVAKLKKTHHNKTIHDVKEIFNI